MRRGNIKKFGRVRKVRKALYKALATALIDKGQIKTTVVKAKSLSRYFDSLITKALKGTVAVRRELANELGPKAVKKLVGEIAPALNGRKGGFTRVIRLGQRMSDGAEMALIEYLK
jgi:large subunit ribosomal protein L17